MRDTGGVPGLSGRLVGIDFIRFLDASARLSTPSPQRRERVPNRAKAAMRPVARRWCFQRHYWSGSKAGVNLDPNSD